MVAKDHAFHATFSVHRGFSDINLDLGPLGPVSRPSAGGTLAARTVLLVSSEVSAFNNRRGTVAAMASEPGTVCVQLDGYPDAVVFEITWVHPIT